jgi:hypothetical protein
LSRLKAKHVASAAQVVAAAVSVVPEDPHPFAVQSPGAARALEDPHSNPDGISSFLHWMYLMVRSPKLSGALPAVDFQHGVFWLPVSKLKPLQATSPSHEAAEVASVRHEDPQLLAVQSAGTSRSFEEPHT